MFNNKNAHLYLLGAAVLIALIALVGLKSAAFITHDKKDAVVAANNKARADQDASRPREMSEKERKVAQMAKRATEEMRESGYLAPKPGKNYTLTNDEGEITTAAMQEAGLDLTRKAEVKAVVDHLWEDMSSEMAKRMVFDEGASKVDQGIRVYKIPADRQFANIRLNQFKEELKMHFGGSESQILFDGLGRTNHFGWFGKWDLTIKFTDANPADSGFIKQVEFSGKDPKTGRVISGGKFAQQGNFLRNYFGSIFDHLDP